MIDLRHATGAAVRWAARNSDLRGPTPGLALGYVQANLVMVPKELAFDFLLFCQRNPKPCPILDVTEPGDPEPKDVALGADLRTDIPAYRIYHHGDLIEEPYDLKRYWREDLVSFLIGCSFTFENALLESGIPIRHIEMGRNVPMYRTNITCRSAGKFHGPLVVSMRPLIPEQAIRATTICARFPKSHGTPIHFGDPSVIGIANINEPDYGDPVEIHSGEMPVFWACGVTPQAVAVASKLPFLITHKPGHMFVTDVKDAEQEE
jgi:uncharacterized protein YcsI (UPF0317 family)